MFESQRMKRLRFRIESLTMVIEEQRDKIKELKKNVEEEQAKRQTLATDMISYLCKSTEELEQRCEELDIEVVSSKKQFGIPVDVCTYCGGFIYTWVNSYREALIGAIVLMESGYEYANFVACHPGCEREALL